MFSEKSPLLRDANRSIPIPPVIGFQPPVDDRFRFNDSSRRVISCVLGPLTTLLFIVIYIFLFIALIRETPPFPSKHTLLIIAEHAAVASENKRCSDIGVNVLKDGGNAVDAAISSALCVGAVNMFSSGIGGGGFMTVRIPPSGLRESSEVFTIDFGETAPGLASVMMHVDDPSAAVVGGLAVAVPGELRGFEEAHNRWGHLPWSRLVRPTVDLAAEWTVDAELAEMVQIHGDLMLQDRDWSAIFAPEGRLLLEGETIRNPNLSRTLGVIADEGPGAFYKGSIADSMVRKVQETGGILTREDLEKYGVKVEHALRGTYHDKNVYAPHAPASGPVLLHMLNLLERCDLTMGGRTALNLHRVVEAMKLGSAAQTRIGDQDYHIDDEVCVSEMPTKPSSDQVVVHTTDKSTHPSSHYNPKCDVMHDQSTTHISVVDKDGMAVALTSSINRIFGSQVLDPETGIVLNNGMNDFSIPEVSEEPGPWSCPCNYPEPGKRPLSSASPTIMEYPDGSFYLAIGSSGGPQDVLQAILNLEWGMNVDQAVEHGRVRGQLYPPRVVADRALPPLDIIGLRKRGHEVTFAVDNRVGSAVQVVLSENRKIYAASDSRKNGIAAGY